MLPESCIVLQVTPPVSLDTVFYVLCCVVAYVMAAAVCDDRLPSIDKLDQSNWPVWKLQIQTYLEARDLWKL